LLLTSLAAALEVQPFRDVAATNCQQQSDLLMIAQHPFAAAPTPAQLPIRWSMLMPCL
jgi:hypothetical protein